MDKLQMAMRFAEIMLIEHFKGNGVYNSYGYKDGICEDAWVMADAMQAEADKREKEESEKKRADIREMLKADNTFIEREGQHFDDVASVCNTYSSPKEWQPDEIPEHERLIPFDESHVHDYIYGRVCTCGAVKNETQ